MLGIENLIFASPWVLATLVVAPVLWWLLRVMPPAPRRVRFPAVALLRTLKDPEETPHRTPLWLILLRLLVVVLVVLGLAQPLVNPPRPLAGAGAVLLVLDNGWEAGAHWPRLRQTALDLVADAGRSGRKVGLALTAPGRDGFRVEPPRHAADVADQLAALEPVPWPGDPAGLAGRLAELEVDRALHGVWITSGVVSATGEDGAPIDGVAALAARLQRMGGLDVLVPAEAERPLVLLPPEPGRGRLTAVVRRSDDGPETTRYVRLVGRDGGVLDRRPLTMGAGATEASVTFDLPLKVRNRAASLAIEGERSAGAMVLLDERWERRPVGLVSGQDGGAPLPLLSDLYYLERALTPYADLQRGSTEDLLQRGQAVLVMADPDPLPPSTRGRLADWIAAGGVLIRFAGPRLASEPDDLVPVRLRRGDRTLGGALSWTEPAHLAAFSEDSPFAGLAVPREVTVSRQVLAEPSLQLSEQTWARLADGTPLVTADRRGDGWLVLVHTTAGIDWSNLALSGLYVDMLRRLIDLSRTGTAPVADRPLRPLRVLDGLGRLQAAAATVAPIPGGAVEQTIVSARHPPGYYGNRNTRRALNLTASVTRVVPLGGLPPGVERRPMETKTQIDFKPWLLTAALLLFLCDLALALVLRGLLGRGAAVGGGSASGTARGPGRRRAFGAGSAAGLLLAVALLGAMARVGVAQAQDGGTGRTLDESFALKATSATYLAYVRTGDPAIDATTRAGLEGLARVLTRRTAAETAGAMGVDVERDELAFFPLLYWAVAADQAALSEAGRRRVNRYLKNGGTILFDTRSVRSGSRLFGGGAGGEALRRVTDGLTIPPLQPVPPDHVLTKAFYLMQEFPGRFRGGDVWVATAADRDRDGVSSVIIGGNDWAAAWAVDETGRPRHPVIPGGERQREMAYRFGVNLVMYTLTGNYKADQVHVPAILERLGQ